MTDAPEPIDAIWVARQLRDASRLAAGECSGRDVDADLLKELTERIQVAFYGRLCAQVAPDVAEHLSRVHARAAAGNKVVLDMTPELREILDLASEVGPPPRAPRAPLRAIAGGGEGAAPPRGTLLDLHTGKTHRREPKA